MRIHRGHGRALALLMAVSTHARAAETVSGVSAVCRNGDLVVANMRLGVVSDSLLRPGSVIAGPHGVGLGLLGEAGLGLGGASVGVGPAIVWNAGHPFGFDKVVFFTGDEPPRIAYEIHVAPDVKPAFRAFDPPKEGTDSFAALVRARQTAIAAMPPSSQPINPVLLPGEGANEVVIYLLAGTKKPDIAVFGRHFRAVVPLGGSAVTSMTPLSKSALEIPPRAPDGAKIKALVVSHIVTDYPLETHVFTSLLLKKVVYVGTSRGVWRVDGDKIAFIRKDSPGAR